MNVVEKNIIVDIIEVPYDFERTAKAIEDSDMLRNEFADMLRKG